jgi:hypothetical protein
MRDDFPVRLSPRSTQGKTTERSPHSKLNAAAQLWLKPLR